MRRRALPPSLRRTMPVAAAVLLLGAMAAGCGLARPSPHHPQGRAAPGSVRHEPRPETPPIPGDAADDPDLTYVLLRLGERRLYLIDGNPRTPIQSFPIAIGRPGHETPTGRFRVEEKVEHPDYVKIDKEAPWRVVKRVPPGPTNPLGVRWIGFTHGESWTIGIHGTPNPELLGRAVSGGCVRMRNADVVRLYERVEIGTTVIVEP